MELNLINFHDAVIHDFQFNWTTHQVLVELSIFYDRASTAKKSTMLFTGVDRFSAGTGAPWGSSHCINTLTLKEGESETDNLNAVNIEMQSGDEIFFLYEKNKLNTVDL